MKRSSRNYTAAAAGACVLALILWKERAAITPAPQQMERQSAAAAPEEAADHSVELPAQSAVRSTVAAPAPDVPGEALPRPLRQTKEEFLKLADAEDIPADEKRRLFFAAAASSAVPEKVRISALMLGLRRIDPALWPQYAGRLLLDQTQPAMIHDALMQDLHARGHEFSLPWFAKVAASSGHALQQQAATAEATYRSLAAGMTAEVQRAEAAAAETAD